MIYSCCVSFAKLLSFPISVYARQWPAISQGVLINYAASKVAAATLHRNSFRNFSPVWRGKYFQTARAMKIEAFPRIPSQFWPDYFETRRKLTKANVPSREKQRERERVKEKFAIIHGEAITWITNNSVGKCLTVTEFTLKTPTTFVSKGSIITFPIFFLSVFRTFIRCFFDEFKRERSSSLVVAIFVAIFIAWSGNIRVLLETRCFAIINCEAGLSRLFATFVFPFFFFSCFPLF